MSDLPPKNIYLNVLGTSVFCSFDKEQALNYDCYGTFFEYKLIIKTKKKRKKKIK